MLSPAIIVDHLRDRGVQLFAGVPDSLLKEFGTYVMANLPRQDHVITANEGGAIALALGHHLRTGRAALVYLQNSGFGNIVNPLLSLADPEVYGAPMLVMIGWRGQPGVKDEPQHVKQGRVMAPLLDALELPWAVLPADLEPALTTLDELLEAAMTRSSPAVVLVEKGTFAPAVASPDPGGPVTDPPSPAASDLDVLPSREAALIATVEAIGDGPVLVATTGMLSRELFEHREASGTDAAHDFLTVGGMGHASAIALGVALAEPRREVWCLDGDGALLMHLGGLAVIADHAPGTYHHVVFNNGVHDSVGGQPTSIGVVDIPAAARALGYRAAARTSDPGELPGLVGAHRAIGGPTLIEVVVRPGNRPGIGRPTRSPAAAKEAFMAALRSGQ